MNKKVLLIISLFLFSISVYAQDVITLRSGEQIKAKVTEISATEIRYKRFEHIDGPTMVILRADVFAINYENGTRDVFYISPENPQPEKVKGTTTATKNNADQQTYQTIPTVNQTVDTRQSEKKKQEIPASVTNTKNANITSKIFRFGVRAGMNFTNMFGYDGLSKTLFGVQSGIVTDFSLPKNFSIQPALLYAHQGYRMTGKYMGQKSTLRITLHYIQIPINVQYKLKVGSKTSLLFQTGPYFGICFLGTGSSDGITLKIKMGNSERDELKRFDFGLGLGVGVQFYGLQVGIGYNFGLYNLRHQYYSEKLRNHGLAITVTYLFGK